MKSVKYKISQTTNIDVVHWLHNKIFPLDDLPYVKGTVYWLVYTEKGTPIGFATMRYLSKPNRYTAFLSRAGVLKRHRKQGLHKRLIRVDRDWETYWCAFFSID